jgi:hypothetical protein
MYVSPKINADRLAASVSLTEGGLLLVTYCMPEVGEKFANLVANEKLARLADELSQTFLTNKKEPGNID